MKKKKGGGGQRSYNSIKSFPRHPHPAASSDHLPYRESTLPLRIKLWFLGRRTGPVDS